ncbi:MAG: ABC transporter substrate binding protein [Gammaproteobacteria bacterium]
MRPCTLVVLVLGFSWASAALARDEPYRVLLLHSYGTSLPITADWYEGIVRGFSSVPDVEVAIDTEAPDLARFVNMDAASYADRQQLNWLLDFYRKNYQSRKPHLIMPTDVPALRFLLVHGEELFPGVPIVFVDADRDFVAAQKLPPNVTGVTGFLDITGTLELIQHVHPDTQRVAVIVGSSPSDKAMERVAQQAFESFAGRLEFVWLRGMPVDELIKAVNTLPEKTVALYLVQFEDRTGQQYVPRAILQTFSDAAKVPVYGLWDTLLQHGIVGGRLATVEEDGYRAAKLAARVLRGEAPADLPVVDRLSNPPIFDGVELARWSIKQKRLPADSRIRNHPASTWDEHRAEILVTVAVITVQALMIAALILSRRRLRYAQDALHDENSRRREAETMAVRLRGQLARFSKERSLGTLATSIAHEINQPLIAIQNYAQAARRRLQANTVEAPKLSELVAKIEGQAERAGAITQHVRALVNHEEPNLRPVSLYPLLQEVIRIMEPEIAARGCHIACEPVTDIPPVLADTLQVQLVLVNLLQNALHSVSAGKVSEKPISVEVRELDGHEVQVSVTDRGEGVPSERVNDIFEPLYSGKVAGMGMGLAICRDIIDTHGGRIWYDPNPEGGAIFRFTLRQAG